MPFKGETYGAFTLERKLGRGLLGEAWRARTKDGAACLVKLYIDPESVTTIRQGTLPPPVESPYVARFLGGDLKSHIPYIVFEQHAGQSVRDILTERKYVPVGAAMAIFLQVLKGLQAIHAKGVAHFNVRPENVLVDEEENVKLTDLRAEAVHRRLAPRILDVREDVRPAGQVGGMSELDRARPYLPPEQARGTFDGPAADAWALGMLLYEMTTGRLPQGGMGDMRNPTRADPRIPKIVDEVCASCLERLPRARVVDFAALEKTVVTGLGRAGFMVDLAAQPAKWLRRIEGGDRPVTGDETRGFASFLKKFVPERLRG